MPSRFSDRRAAGRALGRALAHRGIDDPVVLGLPRGGVPVAVEVAAALDAPVDVLVVRKLGVPWHRELGMGAVGEEGVLVVSDDVVRSTQVSEEDLARVIERERAEVAARAERFRGGAPPLPLQGHTAVIVDDGLATGGTARAAVAVSRARGAARVVVAVPVAPADTVQLLAREADDVICLESPPHFMAVGAWYLNFDQTSDAEVLALLAAAHRPPDGGPPEVPQG